MPNEKKKVIRRSFNSLKNNLTDYQLNILTRKIALDYLSIGDGHPRSHICDLYWISEPCYYSLLKKAVIDCLVTEKEISKMEAKAIRNQKFHAETFGTNTKVKYEVLRLKRFDKVESFKEVKQGRKVTITNNFAESKDGIWAFAMKENVPYPALSFIIEECIIKSWVDDDVCKKIQDKTLETAKDRKIVIEQFQKYKEIRSNKNQP